MSSMPLPLMDPVVRALERVADNPNIHPVLAAVAKAEADYWRQVKHADLDEFDVPDDGDPPSWSSPQ